MSKALILLAMTTLSVALAAGSRFLPQDLDETAYWVWRWSDLELVDSDDALLLYQGDFQSTGDSPNFVKRGVDPFPLPGRSETGLLVRLYDIGDAEAFADQVTYLVRQWQLHDVDISEIQLDYDCPSSRLPDYKRFVDAAKSKIEKRGINISLSATGLLTWLNDDSKALDNLAASLSYIAFQLYDTHDPLPNLDAYFVSLELYTYPYKIGISTSDKFDRMEYPRSDDYQGNLVFLNVAR